MLTSRHCEIFHPLMFLPLLWSDFVKNIIIVGRQMHFSNSLGNIFQVQTLITKCNSKKAKWQKLYLCVSSKIELALTDFFYDTMHAWTEKYQVQTKSGRTMNTMYQTRST